MTNDNGEEELLALARGIMDEGLALFEEKHADYGPHGITGAPGGSLNGIMVRMHDKFERIKYLTATGARPRNETLRDSYIDLMNYSMIALLVIDKKWPKP